MARGAPVCELVTLRMMVRSALAAYFAVDGCHLLVWLRNGRADTVHFLGRVKYGKEPEG